MEGEHRPTVIQDWKIVPRLGRPVVVDSYVTQWKLDEPTAHIRGRLVQFMTRKRTVYRNGWFAHGVFPYVVSDDNPNVYLVLCQDVSSESCDCPGDILASAEGRVHIFYETPIRNLKHVYKVSKFGTDVRVGCDSDNG